LARFVKRYMLKDELFTPAAEAARYLVFDDTDFSKTGRNIESVSKIYDHASKTYYLGFKLLLAGYCNGRVYPHRF